MPREEREIPKSQEVDNAAYLAWEYRKKGYTMSQIARALTESEGRKITARMVSSLLQRVYENNEVNDVALHRTIDAERLERMVASNYDAAMAGDYAAQDRILRCIETRMKLLGTSAPQKTEISGPDGKPILDIGEQASAILDRMKEVNSPEMIDLDGVEIDRPELTGTETDPGSS